jgi:hypothetical protein
VIAGELRRSDRGATFLNEIVLTNDLFLVQLSIAKFLAYLCMRVR